MLGWSQAFVTRRIVVGLILVGLVPLLYAQASPGEAPIGDAATCRSEAPAPPSPAVAARGADHVVLRRAYDGLRALPGFLDVHQVLEGEPRLVAYFDHAPPPVLPALGIPYPLSVEVVSAEATAPAGSRSGDPPLVGGPCEGLRPGSPIFACTFAFFLSGSDGATYWMTAGHCLPVPVGTPVGELGTVAFTVHNGIGEDIALVRLDPDLDVDPAVCHWGGPTGTAPGSGGFGDVVRMYGHGMVFGSVDATKPRSGVLVSMGVESFTYVGPVWNGDSGAPVILEDGLALGVHTHGADFGGPVSTPTVKFGTRLDHGIALAEAALGIDLELLTAPLA